MSDNIKYMLKRDIEQLERLNVEAMSIEHQTARFIELKRLRCELLRYERWGTASILF